MKLVSEVVGGHDVQQQDVLGLRVESTNPELHLRKHLPGKKRFHMITQVTKLQ